MLVTADNKYEFVEKHLDFIMDENTYLNVYCYTIIKSFDVALELELNADSDNKKFNNRFQHKNHTFDDAVYTANAEKVIAKLLDYFGERKLLFDNLSAFIDLYNLINDTATSYDLMLLKELFICSYKTLIDIFLYKADNLEKKDILENHSFTYFYLPIETDCTVSYFVHRYISPIEFAFPYDMGSKTTAEKRDRKELFRDFAGSEYIDYNAINSRAGYIIDRKSELLKELGVSENTSETRKDQKHLKLVKLLVDLERDCGNGKSLRVQNLLSQPSAETIPYQSHSLLKNHISVLMGELYKEFNVSKIHRLIDNQIESYFCLQIGESKNSEIPFAIRTCCRDIESDYKEYIEWIQSASDEFHAEQYNKDSYISLVDNPTSCIEKMICRVLVFKNLSLLNEKTTIYKYIIENEDKFIKDFVLPTDSILNQIVYFEKSLDEQQQCLLDIERILKMNNLKITDLNKYHESIVRVYTNLWGEIYYINFVEYLSALLVMYSINKNKYKKFKYSPFHYRRDKIAFTEAYNISSQSSATPKTIIGHEIYTSEESHLILKMIDTQKLLLAGFNAFDLYRVFKADFELISEYYRNKESVFKALDNGNKAVQIWTRKMRNVTLKHIRKFNIPQ